MNLRSALLIAFLLLGVLPAAVLAWLSFSQTREAMTAAITSHLSTQALALQTDLDALLFERFENAIVWSRSELMGDLRFGDVDKRVTNYLRGLQGGYSGVYAAIDACDAGGRVLASSDPARIGRRLAMGPAPVSVDVALTGSRARLELPDAPRLDLARPLIITTPIPLAGTGAAGPAAFLRLEVEAASLDRLLDAAATGHRAIVVLDAQGRWVAASRALRAHALPDASGRAAGLRLAAATATRLDAGSPWMERAAMVGRGHSRALAGFAGTGWTTLVFEPEGEALAPVARMATIFEGLLVAVLLATLLSASWLASVVARPIAALTASARRYQHEGRLEAGDEGGSRIEEIDVLARAWREMVSSLEQSRRELVRSSQMTLLGGMAAVLAHEVRTPLGIVRSSSQLLKRNAALSPEERELVGFIESETERLNRLVSTMLDLARPREPTLVDCDVHELLRRCAQMHDLQRGEDGQRHPTLLALNARDAGVPADPELLMQVVFNLLNNASHAAGAQGRVELETEDAPQHLVIRCADDGAGISDEVAARLFEPFVTGREGGIGLGLAVARQVVGAHGGEISAGRSRFGGAAITLRLRRRPASSPTETRT